MIRLSSAAILLCLVGSGGAWAQAATPAPVNAPLMPAPAAAKAPAPAAMTSDKQARSKQCSAEADQKGLHGKARKTYRSKCKAGKA